MRACERVRVTEFLCLCMRTHFCTCVSTTCYDGRDQQVVATIWIAHELQCRKDDNEYQGERDKCLICCAALEVNKQENYPCRISECEHAFSTFQSPYISTCVRLSEWTKYTLEQRFAHACTQSETHQSTPTHTSERYCVKRRRQAKEYVQPSRDFLLLQVGPCRFL